MKGDTRLLFVGALVFVFPVLFVLITQSFFDTAYSNIQTSEKRRVGMLHDALAGVLSTTQVAPEDLQHILVGQAAQNEDIQELRLIKRTNEGLLIVNSLDAEKIGTIELDADVFQTSLGSNNTSLIFEFIRDGDRTWQVVRNVTAPDGTLYFIFSEHSFRTIDSTMAARRQQSYLGLTIIFFFLMGLTYWFSKQINWHKKHDALTKQLEERDLFTNMIAHEFRAPLTAINGYTSFLAESTTPTADEKRYIQNIQTSTSRMLALVNDFLEVARIQSGKLSLEMQPIDIQTVLAGVVEALRPTADQKNLVLSYTALVNPVIYTTDAKRLYQVIQNLISNSVKYTDKGSVEVTCEETPLAVTIRIKDTGMGISAEDQQKLFAPFSRVGGVENTSITGTGLGMWITKQLVEALGGTISVESIKNVGTHVVVTLKKRK